MNTKYHKELPDLVQAWNQQLKTEARSSSYLAVLEESAKTARKAKATSKTASKGSKTSAKSGATEGRRRRRRG